VVADTHLLNLVVPTATMSAKTPKTPSRVRSKSLRTPLTPSLCAGINAMNLNNRPSPNKGDQTNPFVTENASPAKRKDNAAELRRQGSRGLIRKGTIEASMDVRGDYVPASPIRRSKSVPVRLVCHAR
jgi:cell division cycle 20, cofactor of APC complex